MHFESDFSQIIESINECFQQGDEFWLGVGYFPLSDSSIIIDAQNNNGLL